MNENEMNENPGLLKVNGSSWFIHAGISPHTECGALGTLGSIHMA